VVWDAPYSTPDWRLPTRLGATLPDRGVVLHASPSLKALGTTVATIVDDGVTAGRSGALGWRKRSSPRRHTRTRSTQAPRAVWRSVLDVPRGLKAAGCPP
jgi:hypothetical protein